VTVRRYSWAALAIILVGALVAGWGSSGPRTDEERAKAIEATIKCPICRSQSVETSSTQTSIDIRNTIRLRLSQGKTSDQIRQELARIYGDDIQLTPPASGVAGLVWVLPVAAFIVAIGGLALAFRHWRRPVTASATAADVDLVDRALHDRLDEPDDPAGHDEPDDPGEGDAPDPPEPGGTS
jgi:cytochrome c-type biogenesis protein CcmH